MDGQFTENERVYLVGPPRGEVSFIPFDRNTHKLYNCPGRVVVGKNGSVLSGEDMYWVKFEEDTQPMRQCQGDWLSRELDIE